MKVFHIGNKEQFYIDVFHSDRFFYHYNIALLPTNTHLHVIYIT